MTSNRQRAKAQRRAEFWAQKFTQVPDPKGRAVVAFERLRATVPAHDQAWTELETTFTRLVEQRERARA